MSLPKSMAADALVTAIDGGRVVVFAHSAGASTDIMRGLLREYPELVDVADVRRVSGDESLTFPGGGTIQFRSFRTTARYRGACLDRVYVPIGTSADVLMELSPTLATSQDGTLTGY